MSIPTITPLTMMVESTSIQHELPGTHDEIVQNQTALGWVVVVESGLGTLLTHPLITGTSRFIRK